ncbi:MAG: DUF5658 family protein [Gammaproteobacteria bacterium]|nr:DUF5658 family protein [Gammaproteobacteria bacterium]
MSVVEHTDSEEQLRSQADRRNFSWRTVAFGFLRSRRRDTRRVGEAEPLFTDYHHPWLFFMATGIMLMNCFDAFFTLQLLDRGAMEVNPIMAAVIGESTSTFAVTKMLLTSVAILVLVFLARAMFMNRIRTGLFLTFFFSCYAVLICYEFVYLLNQI